MPNKIPSALKGAIEAHAGTQMGRKWTLNFDFSHAPEPTIDKTLMRNFKSLNLQPEEKRFLSCACREEIYFYQNLSFDDLRPYVDRLVKKLNQKNMQNAHVVASDFGAFICLAAIFSGELRKDHPLVFDLKDMPLSLFPEKWMNTKRIHKVIEVRLSLESSWLNYISSLANCPDYMPLKRVARRAA